MSPYHPSGESSRPPAWGALLLLVVVLLGMAGLVSAVWHARNHLVRVPGIQVPAR